MKQCMVVALTRTVGKHYKVGDVDLKNTKWFVPSHSKVDASAVVLCFKPSCSVLPGGLWITFGPRQKKTSDWSFVRMILVLGGVVSWFLRS